MTESEHTRTCPLCAEAIKAAAKVCPHCRHWQRKWSVQNPQMIGGICGLCGLMAFACLGFFLERIAGPKRDFAEYQEQITVVSSRVSHRMQGSNLMVTVVGVVTNRSNFSWEHIGWDACFFDRQGKLIDVVIQTGGYGGDTILRHSEQGFRIEGRATKPQADYASHKVTVRWAKDPDAWP